MPESPPCLGIFLRYPQPPSHFGRRHWGSGSGAVGLQACRGRSRQSEQPCLAVDTATFTPGRKSH